MDSDPPPSVPRKVKFAPNPAPRRKSKLVIPKKPEADEFDQGTQQSLLRKAKELQTGKRPILEKEPPVQVAFPHGGASTATATFGRKRESSDDRNEIINIGSHAADSKVAPLDKMQKLAVSLSNAETEGVDEDMEDLSYAVIPKKGKYQEPWDYEKSNYPVTLPLRRPYSGDPELLDKAEFGKSVEYDENSLSSASDLGLLDEDETPRLLMFQFPSQLPLGGQATSSSSNGKQIAGSSSSKGMEIAGSSSSKGMEIAGSSSSKGMEIAGSSISAGSGHQSKKCCSLEDLPQVHMGKMLVYRSGDVKLKVGDILYDVSPGSECSFPQSAMAINMTDKECCELGGVEKRAIVTPDIDSLLENATD